MSTVRAYCVSPDDDSAEMLSLTHLPLLNAAAAYFVCS